MNWTIVFGVAAFVMFLVTLLEWVDGAGAICFIFIICTMVSCNRSEGYQQWAKDNAAKDAAETLRRQTPHVIREADGCKVYAFEANGWHYFTRCGNTVTTERTYTESCGKNCTKKKSEFIVTEGNK